MANKEDTVLISKSGVRHDGRKKDDLRNIQFQIGVLDRADGSALVTWGRNKILAAVYGPRELHPKHMAQPDRAVIRCEYRMATFSVPDRKSPAPKRREREISKILAEALEPAVFAYLYPRSVIDVFIEVLQADGGTRCAAITAASLAIADAGVPMRDLVVGCAAGNLYDQVVLDLDDVEDKEGQGDLPMAYLPHLNKVVLLQSDGMFTKDQYKEAIDMLIPACKKIYEMQRESLKTKYARITEEVGESLTDDKTEHEEVKEEAKQSEPAKEEKKETKIEKSDEKTSKTTETKKKTPEDAKETIVTEDKTKDKKPAKKSSGRKKSSPDENKEKKE
ncbi:MAG: exosome complex exonuclease Rrp41 [Asgard group archaeon]|nr:exosome complex exonuclease Rrp41 [Asgard group archaeon]